MWNTNGVTTPMLINRRLKKHETSTLLKPHLYRSIVNALQYMSITRLDIAFIVNKACQFMESPLESHSTTFKRILWYLRGTINHGLLLSPTLVSQKFSLRAYNDSNCSSDPDDHYSTSRSCIFFGQNLVPQSFKKQPLVARSSTETEHRALAHTTSEFFMVEVPSQGTYNTFLTSYSIVW